MLRGACRYLAILALLASCNIDHDSQRSAMPSTTIVPNSAELNTPTPSQEPRANQESPKLDGADSPMIEQTPQAEGESPNPEEAYIRSLAYSGNGCPENSVSENLSDDAKAFTLLFDTFVTEIGPDVEAENAKSTCTVVVDLQVPNGWTYTILNADFRGFATLDEGVTANQSAVFKYLDESEQAFESELSGPLEADYEVRESADLNALVFAPCGQAQQLILTLETTLSRTSDEAVGAITVDSIDGELAHQYRVQWKECEVPPPTPVNLAGKAESDTEVTLTWTSGGEPTTGFIIAYGLDGQEPVDCAGGVDVGNKTSHLVSGLQAESSYVFLVCAYDTKGVRSASPFVVVETQKAPLACGNAKTNISLREDVNGDGYISPIDALLIINWLNSDTDRYIDPTEVGAPYVDVNGDCIVSPIDALFVINYLNSRSAM